MNIAIFDQNQLYAYGLKVIINKLLSQSANITINESSSLSKMHLVIRTPALSSWEEWQGAFNHPRRCISTIAHCLRIRFAVATYCIATIR